MQLVRISVDGEPVEGERRDDQVLTDDGTFDLDEVDLLAPCEPSKVVAAGKNYVDHVQEMGGDGVPQFPFLFFKPPNSVVGPGDPIVYPDGASVVHYEGELAAVIGQRCRNVSAEDAMDVVLGITCLNDVSWRDWSGVEDQWVRHKGVDTFCPIGPSIQTEFPEYVDVVTRLNGEVRQSATTRGMAFSIGELVEDASRYLTLEAGDVVATGTPAGVGEIEPGDVVEVEVETVGTLRNPVVAESDGTDRTAH